MPSPPIQGYDSTRAKALSLGQLWSHNIRNQWLGQGTILHNNSNLQPLFTPQHAQPKEVHHLLCSIVLKLSHFPSRATIQVVQEFSELCASKNIDCYNGFSRNPLGLTSRGTYPRQISLQGSILSPRNSKIIIHPNPPRILRVHKEIGL